MVSHDADFKAAFADLSDNRQLAIIGFREFFSGEYYNIPRLRIFDIEEEVKAFKTEMGPLPRLRAIDIEDFDPTKYL